MLDTLFISSVDWRTGIEGIIKNFPETQETMDRSLWDGFTGTIVSWTLLGMVGIRRVGMRTHLRRTVGMGGMRYPAGPPEEAD